MKKLTGFLILVLLIAGTAAAQVRAGQAAWVSAKTVDLKASTGIFAATQGKLEYGAEVSVLQISGNWAQVRSAANSSISGWMSSANLSTKRIAATGSTSSASASEVALAGKGFNQEVENSYKTSGNLNYADVDRTEALSINLDELERFVIEGRLAAGGN